MLETAVFWIRLAGIVLTALGLIALAVSGYLGSRLIAERTAENESLRGQVRNIEERYALEITEAHRSKAAEMRSLSLDDHRALVAALQPFSGERVLVISSQEWEPANYAHQIIKSLRTAGLDVRVTYYPENGDGVPDGIDAVSTAGTGEHIASALKKCGIELTATRGATRGEVALELHIGRKKAEPRA